MPVGSVGLMTHAFLLFKLKDDNYVVILEHKVPKVTVNCCLLYTSDAADE